MNQRLDLAQMAFLEYEISSSYIFYTENPYLLT